MRKGELDVDPRGLIDEAYRMVLSAEDCRSILFDWALGLPGPAGPAEIATLLARYGPEHPDHPMTAVLREGIAAPGQPIRRRRRRVPQTP